MWAKSEEPRLSGKKMKSITETRLCDTTNLVSLNRFQVIAAENEV
jgi:hypothetical protein